MLRIKIQDVGHGHCAVVTAPTGRRIMFDAGCSAEKFWWPSIEYSGQHLDLLVVQNMDEDHVADLPDVWRHTSLGALAVNPTITPLALASMKFLGGMGPGVSKLHGILSVRPPALLHGEAPDLGTATATAWWNTYGADFTDTNNLSLVTLVQYGMFSILFAGDLEADGWRRLLQCRSFRDALASVTVLVASHHGRENGCCDEAFLFMRPDIVVFSDGGVRYDSQNTLDWYRSRVRGIQDLQNPLDPKVRRVLTTRRDGTLQINVAPNGRYQVFPMGGAGTHFGDLLASV